MKLIRDAATGTPNYGRLLRDDDSLVAQTLELEWLDNAPRVSCIPLGTYTCTRRYSPKHKQEVFGIDDVPGRSQIEIHSANLASQLLGCVAVGTERGELDGEPAVLHSVTAFTALMTELAGVNTFTLDVQSSTP